MTLMTKNELNSIKKRCNQIQTEKWKSCKVVVGNVTFYDVVTDNESTRPHTKQECEFIAKAGTDISKLIQHINTLERMLHRYQQTQEVFVNSLIHQTQKEEIGIN